MQSGNLKITQLEQNSTMAPVLPIPRVDSSGNIQRKKPDGSWGGMYASRYVSGILLSSVKDTRRYEMTLYQPRIL